MGAEIYEMLSFIAMLRPASGPSTLSDLADSGFVIDLPRALSTRSWTQEYGEG